MANNKSILSICTFALALAACGQAPEYDEAGQYVRVRYFADTDPRVGEIDSIYERVSACIGAHDIAGPLVVFVADVDNPNGHLPTAEVVLPSGPVRIKSGLGSSHTEWALKHEFVHWLLYHSGKLPNLDDHTAHSAPEFLDCVVPNV